ncbi:MAG: glycosyltransferase family 1 protein [Candidatus Omnitrophota bacterium]
MRIGFDARMITHPGIGRYIKNLLSAMFALNTKHEFVLFGDRQRLSTLDHRLSTVILINYTAPIYSAQEQLNAPFSKYNLDILHCPHFNIPYFYPGKLIVTVHDLIYLIFPESAPSKAAVIYANAMMSRSIKRAAATIAVSENTKKDILHFFKHAKPDKIKVIYEAADPCFKNIADRNELSGIKKKYNLPDRFILYVGSLKHHKNLQGAIDVYLSLKEKIKAYDFVVVGRPHKREAHIQDMVKAAGARFLGEVPSEDLFGIYNLADCLLHPSFYEGFGLTVLEAFACGISVVCSNRASLPEVASDAAILVEPDNIKNMANAVFEVLTNENLRRETIKNGYKKVQQFSWEKAATRTIQLYEGL